ncbi:MAG TPA: hypothetical protein ENI23_17735 [bacterium]|nr:hypothetical protein [bacterium]
MANEKKVFQVPACMTGCNALSNAVLKLVFRTQESMNSESMKLLFELYEKTGWLSFNVESIEAENIANLPVIKAGEYESKTPGQRLRSTLYVLWTKKGKPEKTFEEYYMKCMARFQDQVIQQIEECEG